MVVERTGRKVSLKEDNYNRLEKTLEFAQRVVCHCLIIACYLDV
jgi:hypothetical protein